jgi:hypothetical protein
VSRPIEKSSAPVPSWIELESVRMLDEAEQITTLSRETLKRRYPHLVVKLSPRREGMKLKHILAIAGGEPPSPVGN